MWAKICKYIGIVIGWAVRIAGPAIIEYLRKPRNVEYVEKNNDVHNAISDSIAERLRKQKSDSKEP